MVDLSILLWISIFLFLLGIPIDKYSVELSASGWIFFGLYWTSTIPYYMSEPSIIKTFLATAALPVCIYVAYILTTKEPYALVKVGQAIAAMGLIYLPFALYTPLSNWLIEHTARQEIRALHLLGLDAELVMRGGLERQFNMVNPDTGRTYSTYMILACTGIGSMAIFGGLIAAIDAPLRRKFSAFMVSIPVIYTLNLIRNVFITTAYAHQWFQIMEGTVADVFGNGANYASFFWADKVISQSMSVIALVLIAFMVMRVMPEAMDLLEDILDLIDPKAETKPQPDTQ